MIVTSPLSPPFEYQLCDHWSAIDIELRIIYYRSPYASPPSTSISALGLFILQSWTANILQPEK